MEIADYEIDIDKIISIVQENQYKNILLQLPDGLKYHLNLFKKKIKDKVNAEIYFSSDTCYGACDIPCLENLKRIGVDAVFQIGHTSIPILKDMEFSIPIFFINAYATCQIQEVVETAIEKLIGRNIAIVTTAQHIHTLDQAASILSLHHFNPIISNGDHRISSKGQILGCNTSVLKERDEHIDSILFIGSGMFHPIGIFLSSKKPVIIADPFTKNVQRDELIPIKEKILKQRYAAIAYAKQAKTFGIIISTKPGQQQHKKALDCKKIIKDNQKESYIFIMNHMNPFLLNNFPYIDCFVSTACPRIAIDDYIQYEKPLITPVELKIAFGILPYEEYQFDEITDIS